MGKFILWLSALAFIGYGLVSLVSPDIPAGYAGLLLGSADAYAEVGAMYGGLQTGIGLFCLLAAVKCDYYKSGLALLALGVGCLGLARLISLFTHDGSLAASTIYSWGALTYELATASIAALALRQGQNPGKPL